MRARDACAPKLHVVPQGEGGRVDERPLREHERGARGCGRHRLRETAERLGAGPERASGPRANEEKTAIGR